MKRLLPAVLLLGCATTRTTPSQTAPPAPTSSRSSTEASQTSTLDGCSIGVKETRDHIRCDDLEVQVNRIPPGTNMSASELLDLAVAQSAPETSRETISHEGHVFDVRHVALTQANMAIEAMIAGASHGNDRFIVICYAATESVDRDRCLDVLVTINEAGLPVGLPPLPETSSAGSTTADFLGRPLALEPGCYSTKPNEVKCENGQITWVEVPPPSLMASEELREGNYQQVATRLEKAGIEQTANRSIFCRLDGADAGCKVAEWTFPDLGVLRVIFAHTELRDRRVAVVCSYYVDLDPVKPPFPCDLVEGADGAFLPEKN